jgi:hypothetical protein
MTSQRQASRVPLLDLIAICACVKVLSSCKGNVVSLCNIAALLPVFIDHEFLTEGSRPVIDCCTDHDALNHFTRFLLASPLTASAPSSATLSQTLRYPVSSRLDRKNVFTSAAPLPAQLSLCNSKEERSEWQKFTDTFESSPRWA